ncbi:hypothetical protein [Coleofasciculus sp. F4-SAH-05]|uniref:hypothetical protein n=1 Tax=Coleofasciculus sp. F4-SAH-05 TaxID=3069525 RepID=UPI0032F3ECB0
MILEIGEELDAIAWIQLLLDRGMVRYAPLTHPTNLIKDNDRDRIMILEIGKQLDAIAWIQLLLDSYQQRLGKELIQRNGNPNDEAVYNKPL